MPPPPEPHVPITWGNTCQRTLWTVVTVTIC